MLTLVYFVTCTFLISVTLKPPYSTAADIGSYVSHWHHGCHWKFNVMNFMQRQNATRSPSRIWNTLISLASWEVKGLSVCEGISYPYVSRRFIYLFTEGRRGPESRAQTSTLQLNSICNLFVILSPNICLVFQVFVSVHVQL